MEPGNREEKQLKGTQTLQQGKPSIKNLSRAAGVAGEGGGVEKALRQTNHRKDTMTRQTFVDLFVPPLKPPPKKKKKKIV